MTRQPSVTANKAADRLHARLLTAGLLTHYDLLDAALLTERLRVVKQARAHRPTLYAGDEHESKIHCGCGRRFHMAGWFAHLTVEVIELGADAVAGLSGEEPSE